MPLHKARFCHNKELFLSGCSYRRCEEQFFPMLQGIRVSHLQETEGRHREPPEVPRLLRYKLFQVFQGMFGGL